MRYIAIGVYFCFISLVFCKTNVKALTDSNGQEIIEIDGPKELPPGLEEEPGADSDEDDAYASTLPASKKDTKKTTTVSSGRRNLKDKVKPDGSTQEDEEAKLEKELAEIYKDSDYKDITEETVAQTITSSTEIPTSVDEDKPIARAKNSFKFAPDSTSKVEVERFRTSIDEISCKNREKLNVAGNNDAVSLKTQNSSNKFQVPMLIAQLGTVLLTVICV